MLVLGMVETSWLLSGGGRIVGVKTPLGLVAQPRPKGRGFRQIVATAACRLLAWRVYKSLQWQIADCWPGGLRNHRNGSLQIAGLAG